MSEFDIFTTLDAGLDSTADIIDGNRNKIKFGITFLDDVFNGILRSDIIVVAAGSGHGKSEIANHIAITNALSGTKVLLFALESERHEVAMRAAFKALAMAFYKDPYRDREAVPNYLDWAVGDQDFLSKYDAAESLRGLPLTIVYREHRFDITDFEKALMSTKNSTDLVVLDHFHYLDFEGENENREYKEMIIKIRALALEYKKPCIIMSHIRKSDKRYRELVPSQEEIHGTSDLFKVATKVVTLAPNYVSGMTNGFETYMRICKCRQDGSRARYTGITSFDPRTNTYRPKYRVGTLSGDCKEFADTPLAERPRWAHSAEERKAEIVLVQNSLNPMRS
jgi:hypothetical protein